MFNMHFLGIWKTRTLLRVKHHNLIYSSDHHGDHQHTDDVSLVYRRKLKEKKKVNIIHTNHWSLSSRYVLLIKFNDFDINTLFTSDDVWEGFQRVFNSQHSWLREGIQHANFQELYLWVQWLSHSHPRLISGLMSHCQKIINWFSPHSSSANDPDFNKASENEAILNQALYFKSLIKMTSGLLLILCLMDRTKNSQRVNPFTYFRHLFYNRINYFWRYLFLFIDRI